MPDSKKQNRYSTPIFILIFGIVIFGLIYFFNKSTISPIKTSKLNGPEKTNNVGTPKAISADEHILGNPNANIKIIEYSDTECPFSKIFHESVYNIIKSYGKDGKVAWIYRHLPNDQIHPKARKEAEATECAAEIGGNTSFWSMLDKIYSETTSNNNLDLAKLPTFAKAIKLDVTKFNECLSSGRMAATVEAQYQDGIKAGAKQTPYSVIILNSALDNTRKINILNDITQGGFINNVTISTDDKSIIIRGVLPTIILNSMVKTLTT